VRTVQPRLNYSSPLRAHVSGFGEPGDGFVLDGSTIFASGVTLRAPKAAARLHATSSAAAGAT
jgi:hypothetical protein